MCVALTNLKCFALIFMRLSSGTVPSLLCDPSVQQFPLLGRLPEFGARSYILV